MYQRLNLMINNLFANYWRPMLITLAILMWMWWLFAPVHAQAPFNNANTYIINMDSGPVADIVSNIGETFGPISPVTRNVAYVSLFQDLASAAMGHLVTDPDGNLIPRPPVTLPDGTTGVVPVPDNVLKAVLTKHGVVKVFDATGTQIFP